ncbi:MAG: DNA-binding protein [Candidatus Nanohaloarchaea archaeon]
MEDEELEELRKKKRKERAEEQEEIQDQQEEVENQIWSQAVQYMTDDARERLSNIKAADTEKAIGVARQVAMLGESGRMGKIDDEQMKDILKSIEEEKSESDIKFRR